VCKSQHAQSWRRNSEEQFNLAPQNTSAKETTNSDSTSTKALHDIRHGLDTSESITKITEKCSDDVMTLKKDEKVVSSTVSSSLGTKKTHDNSPNLINNTTDVQMEQPSTGSTDESRSSPVESLGKDSSTGDEWEKDFDLEINENDLKNLNLSNQDSRKEEEDDWEKWQ